MSERELAELESRWDGPEDLQRALLLYDRLGLSWVERLCKAPRLPKYKGVVSEVRGLRFPLGVRMCQSRETRDAYGEDLRCLVPSVPDYPREVRRCVRLLSPSSLRGKWSITFDPLTESAITLGVVFSYKVPDRPQASVYFTTVSVPYTEEPDAECPGCNGSGLAYTGVVATSGIQEAYPCECMWVEEEHRDLAHGILYLLKSWAEEKA